MQQPNHLWKHRKGNPMTRMTVGELGVKVDLYHEAITKMVDGMDARQIKTDDRVEVLTTKVSKGEGTLGLLVKLVIGSVIASVVAVVGYVGKATGLW